MDQTNKCELCNKPFQTGPKARRKRFCTSRCRGRAWAAANREALNANVREYRKRRYKKDGYWRDDGPKAVALKGWMIELKSQPCHDCKGTFEICCMDFDHRDGEEKSFNVGSMFAHHYSRQLIESEIAKCDLVCANCHRIRTRDRRRGNGTSRF